MKPAYITSPLRASDARQAAKNVAYTKLCKLDSLVRHGETPYVPHIDLTLVLRDSVASHRALGMRAGKAMMRVLERNAVYLDIGVSDGMREDIDLSTALGIKTVERRLFAHEPSVAEILLEIDALEREIG